MSPTRAWREPMNTAPPRMKPRIRQLLDALQNKGSNPTTSGPRCLALKTYLIEEGDCSSLKVAIAHLAQDFIPRSYESFSRAPERALIALGDVMAILNALQDHCLQAQCYDIIAERWTGIMQWLLFLGGYGERLQKKNGIQGFTAMFLQEAFFRGRPCRDELMHHPSSLKYLMLLLTRLDHRTGKYLYECEGGSECSILWLLGLYLESDDTLAAFLSHITPESRRSLVSAIVARPMQIAATAYIDKLDLLNSAAKSVRILCIFASKLTREPALSRKFFHRNLFGELGKALFTLADMVNRGAQPGRMLCWETLSTCLSSVTDPMSKMARIELQSFSAADTANLPLILSTLLEPGMVSCAIHAFKYIKMNKRDFGKTGIDRLMEHILRDFAAHMAVSRIARAATAGPYPGLGLWWMGEYCHISMRVSLLIAFRKRNFSVFS
ncbi:hypothetical protein DFP72DRAFT_1142724 [Ephemerocybe angulata]|uniref:Uncharacterized protein n=1 Tax=Ephemerocybe angulata TaxID=980116 RepID=A0A8H6HMU9_9AGAR|nr:hypothetical protein DFP72DRAFT_1142724 [Tulosesus angulatus]